jgi:hypothetical protein
MARGRPADTWDMTTPTVLLRYTQDLGYDTRIQARYIGNLEDGRSKVSVNSSLSGRTDRADHFRFRMTADGFVRIRTGELDGEAGKGTEVAKAGTVRYQLLSPSGQIIADSDPEAGAAFEAWEDLESDQNLQLTKGSYTIRVARGEASVDSQDYVYSFTFRSGQSPITDSTPELASREFLTTERLADPTAATYDQSSSVTAILGLFADVRVF